MWVPAWKEIIDVAPCPWSFTNGQIGPDVTTRSFGSTSNNPEWLSCFIDHFLYLPDFVWQEIAKTRIMHPPLTLPHGVGVRLLAGKAERRLAARRAARLAEKIANAVGKTICCLELVRPPLHKQLPPVYLVTHRKPYKSIEILLI
jgi:hypothetical protein